jgi:hypothetical protein
MTSLVAAIVAFGLAFFLLAHAALLASLFRRPPRLRALAALLVPPLVPYWSWQAGKKRLVYVWGGALVIYAMGVALLKR